MVQYLFTGKKADTKQIAEVVGSKEAAISQNEVCDE